jgi:hypothetical protein
MNARRSLWLDSIDNNSPGALEKGQRRPMTEKTRTIVVIESHEQTIIRRARRTISAQVVTLPPEHAVQEKRKSLGRWWKRVALKSATAFAPLRGLKRSRNGQPKTKS